MPLPIIPIIGAVGALASVIASSATAVQRCDHAKKEVNKYNENKNKK